MSMSFVASFLHQHSMALLGGETGLINRGLSLARVGDTQIGSLAVKMPGSNPVPGSADPVQAAPGKGIEGLGIAGRGMTLDDREILGAGAAVSHPVNSVCQRRGRRRRRYCGGGEGGSGLFAQSFRAGGVRRGHTAIGIIKMKELGPRRRHDEASRRKNQEAKPVHRAKAKQQNPKIGLITLAVGLLLLGACTMDDIQSVRRPGVLGQLLNSPTAPATVSVGGPTGAIVQGSTPPLMTAANIDTVVAEPLRLWLTPAERERLAAASQAAIGAPTGTAVSWQATDGTGSVTADGEAMPAGDVFRSRHGHICRDMRQKIAKSGETRIVQATLCRDDQSLWVVAQID